MFKTIELTHSSKCFVKKAYGLKYMDYIWHENDI